MLPLAPLSIYFLMAVCVYMGALLCYLFGREEYQDLKQKFLSTRWDFMKALDYIAELEKDLNLSTQDTETYEEPQETPS